MLAKQLEYKQTNDGLLGMESEMELPHDAVGNDHITLFKARLALMDYKGKFIACFAKAEASLWSYSTDLT